jgi:hypothetical protein
MSAKFKLKSKKDFQIYSAQELLSSSSFKESFAKEAQCLREVESESLKKIEFHLQEQFIGLKLKGTNSNPILLDLDKMYAYFFKQPKLKTDPLLKAITRLNLKNNHINDVTAGLLGDSMKFISWGVKVTAYEANPLNQLIILNAIRRCSEQKVLELLNFVPREFSWNCIADHEEVIFYDPFFYKDKEKTSVTKEMKFLREFDFKAQQLIKSDKFSVIVKRPKGGPEIWENVSYSYFGKAVRLDIYKI